VSRSFHPPPGPGASSACGGLGPVSGEARDGRGGWQLVQIAELLVQIERLGGRALRILGEVDGDLAEGASLHFSSAELAEATTLALDVAQLAERLQELAEALPGGHVEVAYPDVAAAAAHELAQGIIDAGRARLAARLLDRDHGWRALAQGLEQGDSHTVWEDTSIADLLGGFRDVTPDEVRALAAEAGLTAGAEIADCDPDEVVRLAASLAQRASSPLE
jgi:hypothetical protein